MDWKDSLATGSLSKFFERLKKLKTGTSLILHLKNSSEIQGRVLKFDDNFQMLIFEINSALTEELAWIPLSSISHFQLRNPTASLDLLTEGAFSNEPLLPGPTILKLRREFEETLKGLEPLQRLNIICKLIPYVLPKTASVHHTLGEPQPPNQNWLE
jgi:small nuclear ribonucleoprotein (snRNP)-like protein